MLLASLLASWLACFACRVGPCRGWIDFRPGDDTPPKEGNTSPEKKEGGEDAKKKDELADEESSIATERDTGHSGTIEHIVVSTHAQC